MDFKRLTDKAKQIARRNPDKVERALDRAGDFVDQRTGRKYGRHVDTVQQKARQFLGGGRTTEGPATGEGQAERPGEQPGEGPDEPGSAERPGDAPDTGRPEQHPRP